MDNPVSGNNPEESLRQAEQRIKEQNNELYELKRKLFEEKQHTADIKAQIAAYAATYTNMINSTSWKVTKPLRKAMEKVKRQPPAANPADAKGVVSEEADRLRYNAQSSVHDLLKKRFRGLQAIPSLNMDDAPKRLNFVTDSIEAGSALGGVATALIIATEFCRRANLPLRIITRTTPVNPADYAGLMRVNGIEPVAGVTFYTDYDRDENGEKPNKLDVSPNDVFFATSWWGAEAIRKTSLRKRFFYVIQEVETFFYPHGDDHFLCSRVMQNKNIDFIINSGYLYDYFAAHTPNITENGVSFEPAFPESLYHSGGFTPKQKHKLFFYSRPNNPRNMFFYGIRLLEKAVEQRIIDTDKWDIYCAGQDTPSLRFSNGYEAVNLGLMTWQKYSEFLRDTDLTFSLMYTPHPSYPPYDAACSGSVVLTNKCKNKQDFPWCGNVILSGLGQGEMLDSFERAIALAQDADQRRKNYEALTISRSWQQSLDNVMRFMGERYV